MIIYVCVCACVRACVRACECVCFMLCRLKYDDNDFNTVSFFIIWCYDVISCDICLV